MSETAIGLTGVAALILLLMSSIPVAYAMAIVGIVGFAVLRTPHAALSMAAADLYGTFTNYNLTVIPLFVLMGQLTFHAGVSRRLFFSAYRWLGPLPGGLAMATVGACTAFGAICGSGPATAATMAAVALPEMRRYGYAPELASGAVAAGGSLGMLIPPSVVFIVYAIMTEQSVGKLFIAGIVPGIVVAALFCLTIYVRCRRNPALGPACPPTTWREKFAALQGVTETALLFVLVIGGMFLGFFTPTEAAAIGAAGSLLIAAAKRALTFGVFAQALKETARTSCMVLMIVAGAVIFGRFLALTRIPHDLASLLSGLQLPGWTVMAVIILFYLLSGCVVDALALILLTTPIFYPVVVGLGYDPIWFGVLIVIVTQMGVISPPVGVNAYVVSGIARDIPIETVFKGSLPFLCALIAAAALLVAFPGLALFLTALVK